MRKIQTSLYVKMSVFQKLEDVASANNIKTNALIVLLLRKYLKENRKTFKIFKTVQYQAEDPACQWKTHHVSFNDVDYELFTDMRKLFKKSVSLILKLAVCEYILGCKNQIFDNYCKVPYRIENKIEQNNIVWSIYWHKTLFHSRK